MSISSLCCWLATVLLWRSSCALELQKVGRLGDSKARPRAVSRAHVGMPLRQPATDTVGAGWRLRPVGIAALERALEVDEGGLEDGQRLHRGVRVVAQVCCDCASGRICLSREAERTVVAP